MVVGLSPVAVTYLGCILDETMSRESMALKVINKTNSRLKSLQRKSKYLTPALCRLSCNVFIQPHFDYTSQPGILPHSKDEKQNSNHENKCIRYCLQLDKMTHISKN